MQDRTGEPKITGNLVNAYFVCPRKAWFYARQLNPDPDMELLVIGRLVSEESYSRNKKEIQLEGIKIDLIVLENNSLVICEIKKSSKELTAARMQLLFYLNNLKTHGFSAKGEIRIPKERKKITVELDDTSISDLANTVKIISQTCSSDTPPSVKKQRKCKKCAFFELCFA
ncbi:CRISPR-associated protein Cas4 [Thermodesulforhabdus norvegica]|uniref:CRISPR-associated exonuclease Cas4 n=1 Tax=Thermodesulforhabdus norvegica TaxID=39841 RepID=A0A1I4TNA8_9BACT|nr:CRISPR-associated protein Cas4 [Thermodesulforhabdus norvegica]SFM78050.1 CRISPR-associated exonuclease, Cas4 family [Thermodesulforhabdus norvegica]